MSSFRLTSSVAVLVSCFVLGGCPEPDPLETDNPTPTPPTPETAETGLAFFDVAILNLTGQFGFDSTTNAVVPVTVDGNQLAPLFEINLGNEDWGGSPSAADDFCTIAYDMSGLTATVNSGAEPWLEIMIPEDAPTLTNCDALDPAVWGEDPSEEFRGATFGIQIGTLASDVRDWLEPQLQPGELDEFNGGVLLAPDVLSEPDAFTYSNIYETDASLNVTLDENAQLVPLAESTLRPDAPTAWYTVSSASLWSLQ